MGCRYLHSFKSVLLQLSNLDVQHEVLDAFKDTHMHYEVTKCVHSDEQPQVHNVLWCCIHNNDVVLWCLDQLLSNEESDSLFTNSASTMVCYFLVYDRRAEENQIAHEYEY